MFDRNAADTGPPDTGQQAVRRSLRACGTPARARPRPWGDRQQHHMLSPLQRGVWDQEMLQIQNLKCIQRDYHH